MEPVSGIANVIAILSLAIQLGECAIRTKSFLDAISHSPSEVLRLRRLIDQSHAIADNVKNILNLRQGQQLGDQQGSESVYTSLAMCLEIASQIETILNKSNKIHQGTVSLSRGWAQFRLACKQGQIENLEHKFYGAITILNITLNFRTR